MFRRGSDDAAGSRALTEIHPESLTAFRLSFLRWRDYGTALPGRPRVLAVELAMLRIAYI